MTLAPDSRCPGSGARMIFRTYVVRRIEAGDRAEHALRLGRAEARDDPDDCLMLQRDFEEWERDQGQSRERLVCAVCGDAWLTPTARGTSRPHARRDTERATWDQVRQVRRDIGTLEAELDRLLHALED